MSKIGRSARGPGDVTYCRVRLDSGEKILVSHEKSGLQNGRLAVEIPRWLGLNAERVCVLDLDTVEGRASMLRVLAVVPPRSDCTPLESLVEYVQEARDVDDVRWRCRALYAGARVA
jgi:hypothetical protein